MSSAALKQLQPGDKVTLKRNLDHPAWKIQGPYDEYEGARTLVRNPNIEEVLGTATILERRDIPATNTGWRDRKAKSLVRLANNFWYDLATGLQDKSEATLIELIEPAGTGPEQ